jgi:glycosyltransferase involved in cell wall biosynthesis
MSSLKLTVIAPVYNEEDVIRDFHVSLCEVLATLGDVDANILYVVDRCTDNTLEVLTTLVEHDSRAKVIVLSSRFGHQMSLLAGIDNALNSDAIIMMDSDLQHPPELIPVLIDNFRRGFEVVYTIRQDNESFNALRKLTGVIFYWLLSKLSETPINANAADFRLISGRVAKVLSVDFRERNMFLRGLFAWMGFRQIGVEYIAQKRGGGRSKYSLSRMLQLGGNGILSFSAKPLKLGIFVGVIFSFLAFFMMLWTVIQFLIDKSIPSGWTTLALLLLMFSGIQLFFLGVIGAYIGGIYEEVKDRPRYIIDKEIVHDEKFKS